MNAPAFANTQAQHHDGIDVASTEWLQRMDAALAKGREAERLLQRHLNRGRHQMAADTATEAYAAARQHGSDRVKAVCRAVEAYGRQVSAGINPIRLADFAPTTPAPLAGVADPHVAGRHAQIAHLARCRAAGVAARPADLDAEYWQAYRAVARLAA